MYSPVMDQEALLKGPGEQGVLLPSSGDGVPPFENSIDPNSVSLMEDMLLLSSSYMEPGVYYDEPRRVFRLRCKNSMYAFRVDDAKNLEHLYWGPPLPPGDDILYLTKAHVRTPFDPAGQVSAGQKLGLEELTGKVDPVGLTEKWKVFTKQKGAEEGGGQPRGRRLENASWRMWHLESGCSSGSNDMSLDRPDVVSSANEGDRDGRTVTQNTEDGTQSTRIRPDRQGLGAYREARVISRSVDASPIRQACPTHYDAGRSGKSMSQRIGMSASKSVGNVMDLQRKVKARAPLEGEMGVVAKEELGHGVVSLSPGMRSRQPSSSALSSLSVHGSASDFALLQQDSTWSELDEETVGKNTKLLEYSDVGTGDYREPSLRLSLAKDGSSICPLVYKRHTILRHRGKPAMPSHLPGIYVESKDDSTTLIVDMHDPISKIVVKLYYTVMHKFDIITRRTVITNEGTDPVRLFHLAAATVDFDAELKFYMTQLSGGWARERQVVTRPLEDGVTVVKSTRGASSHQFNPFVAITPCSEPLEDNGECFGFCFVYSGNFLITAEVSEYRRLRVNVGINPEGFSWLLDTEDENSFASPELIMAYSNEGLGQMSREMHRLIREHLIPKQWRYKVPPILINTWEAVYFDVKHEVIVEIARVAAQANIELLVLDDGWFGERHNSMSGLGDWTPNQEKLPFGVDGLARVVNDFGMKFGVWIEPEMVSIESALYRAHPDWCLNVPGRKRTTGRNQLVLDFSRVEVRDHIFSQIYDLLSAANVEYVKWDMNRHLTEVFSRACSPERQGEIAHRFILGVYEVMGRVTKAFPYVLLENCSGGGGRFDAGMLYYSSQIWASDNTDAISRVGIQYGTSLAYPASVMGSHVSTVPNHQTLRTTTMKTRSLVAMSGTFGYELDPRNWTQDDIEEIQGYIRLQKRIAPLVYEGDMYRLWSPYKSDSAAWMFVARDKMRAVVIAVNIRREVGRLAPRLRLRGLVNEMTYCVEELCPGTVLRNVENGAIENDPRGVYQFGRPLNITGQTLAHAGLPVKFQFDGDSVVFELNAVCRPLYPT